MPFPLGRLELQSAETLDDIRRNRYRARVAEEFRWKSATSPRSVTAPKGYVTDGASIPRLFQRLIGGPLGPYRAASTVHDVLYSGAGVHGFSRKDSDGIFLEILLEIGVKKWRAYAIYWGVRLGGWRPWSRYRKANEAAAIKRVEIS